MWRMAWASAGSFQNIGALGVGRFPSLCRRVEILHRVNEGEDRGESRKVLPPNRPIPRQAIADKDASRRLKEPSSRCFALHLLAELARTDHAAQAGAQNPLGVPVHHAVRDRWTGVKRWGFRNIRHMSDVAKCVGE